jgi:hypothetical protein
MQSLEALPNFQLQPGGEVTAQFLALCVTDFHSAARYVYQLPYGRNSDRANCRLVLSEGYGTCSTKHALLAELAQEQGVDITLTIGIYAMTERNTPGVGAVLEQYHLAYLPEAHCYLSYNGARIDVTRSGAEPVEPIASFLYEEAISPEQIGDYKVALHQRFLQKWVAGAGGNGQHNFAAIWHIREACIAALSA